MYIFKWVKDFEDYEITWKHTTNILFNGKTSCTITCMLTHLHTHHIGKWLKKNALGGGKKCYDYWFVLIHIFSTIFGH